MRKATAWITGASLGAVLMYLLDPERGRRRRALIRDKMAHSAHLTKHTIDVTTSDLTNRIKGMRASAGSLFRRGKVSDEVLTNRVRSVIGRAVSHPSSIDVMATNGHVTLSGPILADEVHWLLKRVYSVKGVKGVDHNLEIHHEAGHVPGLQGQARRRGRGPKRELMQTNWTPAVRLMTGVAGGAAGIYGLSRRGPYGAALGAAGLTLLARATTNMELKRLFGIGAGRRAVDIQKTMNINAPAERVFELLANPENFPNFMSHVREVKKIDPQRWRWYVIGPMGASFQWDTVTTSYEPNKKIAWRTEPGAVIQHAGIARLQPNPDGTTTVDIKLSYNPVAGALGHAVASVLGADPKHQLDEDMVRMKTYTEIGVVPHDIARRRGISRAEARPH